MKNNLFLFVLCLGTFAVLSTELGVMGIIPLIAEYFGVDEASAGLSVSVFAMILVFVAPVVPMLARFNTKLLMMISLAVFALCSLLACFVENYTLFLVLRAVPAFFQPLFVSLALSSAANSVSKENEASAVAKIFMAVSAGMVLGIPLANYIGAVLNFHASMAFFFVLNLAALICTALFVPDMPKNADFSYKKQLGILRLPSLWVSIGAVLALCGGVFGFYSYLGTFLQKVSDFGYQNVTMGLFVYGLTMLFGNLLAGKLLVVKPLQTLFISPFVLLLLYLLLFALGANALFVMLIVLALGVFSGIINNANHFMLLQLAPSAKEFANGLFISACNVGLTLGTSFCGYLIRHFEVKTSVLAAIVLMLCGWVLVLLRAWMMRRTQ